MSSSLRPALVLMLFFTVLTGILYPLVITGISHTAFPQAASGSLVMRNGKPIGSILIGQNFSDPKYFWGRPSATTPQPYAGTASTGSNLGPLNPALTDGIKAHIQALQSADPGNKASVPVDLVTASASGLDPEESVAAALYQAPRVARVRGVDLQMLRALISAQVHGRWLGVFGEPRVNVLALNLALDDLAPGSGSR
ncbi:MAG TPA: potassium-transporting ATPase subunit KdpC [Steroidobacteraceae bacterium]|jgi:K+-transporting ATPase ATPase C chain|nr:potassium-transporting ATPase subunit KdpC [Steroidobacteraceae bacterium]